MQSDKEEFHSVCDILDKLIVKQLHLMEEKMCSELNIESSINIGSIHLAKSRYIMGQNSVSTSKLPVENSPEFSASTICEAAEEDGITQFKVAESKDVNIVNPLHWFGILVPQNMHKAKSIFQNSINYVVECVNIQIQVIENMKNIDILKKYKAMLNP